ncbi:MAG TPA: dephospho-CoA kinase [Gemmatimonadales bacterium]|nr:dephospho-CoA kinase [Gemmatimonadales bacterium]
MLHVALTGNVASGKSTVAQLFQSWGATLIDADRLVRQLQAPGTPVFQAIVSRFGSGILTPAGELDRPALRRRVLSDPSEMTALEAIVHPAVAARQKELLDAAAARKDRIVVSEIPLLFEVGDPDAFDAVVLVDAPESLRRERLITWRGLSPEEADRLIAAQQPSAAKREQSTFVIDNEGDRASLERAARAVWRGLLYLI